jgi:hypothetical protein
MNRIRRGTAYRDVSFDATSVCSEEINRPVPRQASRSAPGKVLGSLFGGFAHSKVTVTLV